MKWLAKAAFGLEGQVSRDLKRLGFEGVTPAETGGVFFDGSPAQAYEANLWMRCADRIMLVMGQEKVTTFDDLFEMTRALPWSDVIPRDGAFPVQAHCARSQLMSPSDCQAIVKKAVAEHMKSRYRVAWCEESGQSYPIDVAIHGDMATISLNTSGDALNKRGYRTWNGEAPLRETLAAALLLGCGWRPSLPLYDPCCGTGTLLIEGAFIAADRAPGLTRSFACDNWPLFPERARTALRAQARERYEKGFERPMRVMGSDIDAGALELCRRHLRQAGLSGRVTVEQKDLRDVTLALPQGVFIANPPYGERLGDRRSAAAVECGLGQLYLRHPGWSLSAISSDPAFERNAGLRADRRRRFYNGRLECELLSFAPRPSHHT